MNATDVFLAVLLSLSIVINIAVIRRYQQLKYICLTNAKMFFTRDSDGFFEISIRSKKKPWSGSIGYVYRVLSSPDVFLEKLASHEERQATEGLDEYNPGDWKSAE